MGNKQYIPFMAGLLLAIIGWSLLNFTPSIKNMFAMALVATGNIIGGIALTKITEVER